MVNWWFHSIKNSQMLVRDDPKPRPKLLDGGGEIPKSQGRGWRFDSRLWNLLFTWHKTCQVVNCLLCFGVDMLAFCQTTTTTTTTTPKSAILPTCVYELEKIRVLHDNIHARLQVHFLIADSTLFIKSFPIYLELPNNLLPRSTNRLGTRRPNLSLPFTYNEWGLGGG